MSKNSNTMLPGGWSFVDILLALLGMLIILNALNRKVTSEEYRKWKNVEQAITDIGLTLENVKGEFVGMRNKYADLKQRYDNLNGAAAGLRRDQKNKESKIARLEEETGKLRDEIVELAKADLGLALKGKHVVLLIDYSGSMGNSHPDALLYSKKERVLAGVLMLLGMLEHSYMFDVAVFPGSSGPVQAKWGAFHAADPAGLTEAESFLNGLSPHGNTPTLQALTYALTHYPNVTDILLFSDGVPDTPFGPDDLATINTRGVRIHTIAVGQPAGSPAEQFLKGLADRFRGTFLRY